MPSTEKNLIEEIYHKRAKNDENTITLANMVRSVITDTLSGDKYLNELLQNADDLRSPSIEFILIGKYLIFKHKGRHFDEEDVIWISDAANPNRKKVTDSNQIGNKGIGFKAVFSMASSVTIISNNYCFRFDENYAGWQGNPKNYPWQIIPIWTDKQELPEQVKTYCDNESVHFIFHIRQEVLPQIRDHLKKLVARHFLFLRHTKKMLCILKDEQDEQKDIKNEIALQNPQPVFRPEKGVEDFTINEIKLDKSRSYYIFTRKCPLSAELTHQLSLANDIPEKYKAWKSIPISMAIFVKDGNLTPLPSGQRVFCYLPTELNFGLQLLINAEFLLDTSRMQLREGAIANAWNGFILENVFFEQIRFLSVLNLRSQQWSSVFNVLSPPQALLGHFEETCKTSFKNAINTFNLTTNLAETHVQKISNTVIDTHKFIAKFGNEALQKNCANPATFNTKLILELGAKPFNSSDIMKVMQETWFLQKIKDPEQNRAFIEFFAELYERIKSNETKEALRKFFQAGKFILSNRSELKNPSEIYFPDKNLVFLTEKASFIDMIHPVLFESKVSAWLASMEVGTLQLRHIIQMANKTETELVSFTLHLAKYLQLNEDIQKILSTLKVKTQCGNLVNANQSYLPAALEPRMAIEDFVNADGELLLHQDYIKDESYKSGYKQFLLALGVHHVINNSNLSLIVKAVNNTADTAKVIKFTQLIFTQFFIGKKTKQQQELLSAIKSLKIVSKQGELLMVTSCYLADCYMPEQPLEDIVPNIPYISADYITDQAHLEDWANLFLQLGARNTIRVDFYHDLSRNTLVEKDPASAQYFTFLEKVVEGGNLYPFRQRSYMHNHCLNGGYIQIEFIDAIVTTPLFWQLLIKYWDNIHSLIQRVRYTTYASDKVVPSNIHYLVDKAIKKAYGEAKNAADYYGQEIVEKLGQYATDLAVADITQGFSTEQLYLLGFKAYLSLDICQAILNAIAETNKYQNDFQRIIFIYQNILWHANQSDTTKLSGNLILLNQPGHFVPASSLHYIIDDYLPHTESPFLIKKPETFSSEEFQAICNIMTVTLISYQELIPEPQGQSVQSDLVQYIETKLINIIYLEAHKQDWIGESQKSNGADLYNRLKAKLEQLTCFCAETIHITYKQVLAEPIDLWIDKTNNIIYHCPHHLLDIQDQQKLYEYLHQYLELSFDQADFISIMTLSEDKLKRKYQSRVGNFKLEDFAHAASALSKKRKNEKANISTSKQEAKKRVKVNSNLGLPEFGNPQSNTDSKMEEGDDLEASENKQEIISSSSSLVAQSTGMINHKWIENPRPLPFFSKHFSNHKNNNVNSMESSHNQINIVSTPQVSTNKSGGFFSERFTRPQREAIGRRGEEAVYKKLLEDYTKKYGAEYIKSTEQGFVIELEGYRKEINWLNKHKESYQSYDFEITVTRNNQVKTRHLEVKTTTSYEEDTIEVSYSAGEWQLMANNTSPSHSHRLFVVRSHVNDEGELIIDNIHKKNLIDEISQGQATVTDFKRIKLSLTNL